MKKIENLDGISAHLITNTMQLIPLRRFNIDNERVKTQMLQQLGAFDAWCDLVTAPNGSNNYWNRATSEVDFRLSFSIDGSFDWNSWLIPPI